MVTQTKEIGISWGQLANNIWSWWSGGGGWSWYPFWQLFDKNMVKAYQGQIQHVQVLTTRHAEWPRGPFLKLSGHPNAKLVTRCYSPDVTLPNNKLWDRTFTKQISAFIMSVAEEAWKMNWYYLVLVLNYHYIWILTENILSMFILLIGGILALNLTSTEAKAAETCIQACSDDACKLECTLISVIKFF